MPGILEAISWVRVEDQQPPKDGRMLLLKLRETPSNHNSLVDGGDFVTIGFNTLEDTDHDDWHIAGWCWSHDCMTEYKGPPDVISWADIPNGLDPVEAEDDDELDPIAEADEIWQAEWERDNFGDS